MENPDFLYPDSRGSAAKHPAVLRAAVALGALLAVLGCAGPIAESRIPNDPRMIAPAEPPRAEGGEQITIGVDHVVERGQTLWRIAQVYGIDLGELARANGIDDPTKLEVGQVLFVPGAVVVRPVPAYPSPIEAAAAPAIGDGDAWLWPLLDAHVLSGYGAPRRSRTHQGIDLRGAPGQAVVASRAGSVVYSGSGMSGYGKTVIVDHGDGTTSLYAHNSQLLVHEGQHVERGEAIARIGRTGNASSEHCHFEIHRDGRPVDPLAYLESAREARR